MGLGIGNASNATVASSIFGRPMTPIRSPSDPKYSEYLTVLADDRQFEQTLTEVLSSNSSAGLTLEGRQLVINAATANVANLTPEERAQIIAEARTIYAGAGHRPTITTDDVIASIGRMSNNQGYTGPDAGVVVATTSTASGGTNPVTRGQILDNENFGNLVNSVFTAAGGKPNVPAWNALGKSGMPGDLFNGGGRLPMINTGIDITKMSEAERIDFLNEVARLASDGTMSWEEQNALQNRAAGYSRNGDDEPAAVMSTSANISGKPIAISKDDLMENGTFEKQLKSLASQKFGLNVDDNPDTKALRDAISTANYDELGYDERVALVQAFNAANSDNKISAQEADGIAKMIQEFQKPSGAGGAASTGTTLSNGLVVNSNDVASPNNFMTMVNAVLDRSGVTTVGTNPFTGTSYYGLNGFSNDQSAVRLLRGLEVSQLTPAQRIEVLEMISQAASDREVTQAEVDAIQTRVNVMSGRGSNPYRLA